jgi:phage terminase large subunit-like protein
VGQSLIERVTAKYGAEELAKMLSPEAMKQLQHTWRAWARPEQLPPPGDWRTWMILAGRGWGKTRTGAEWTDEYANKNPKARIALVGPTAGDIRDVMVEGESGLLNIARPGNRPKYEPTNRRLTWPNGAQATTFSADEPERLRGPQHHVAWCDEVGSWRYPQAWDMLQLGLRLGDDNRCVVTTTPKPTRIIRDIVKSNTTVLTTGSTYDNAANLSDSFMDQIVSRYEGTRLGEQELYARILDDVPGALWSRASIEASRVASVSDLQRLVVAVDPAVSNRENSDETGIVVAGIKGDGNTKRVFILADYSVKTSPDKWGQTVVNLYHEYQCDAVVCEKNQGGDLITALLKTVDRDIPLRLVSATRGKITRAEPVAALYEQRLSDGRAKVVHVGTHRDLEDQMCAYTSVGFSASPDRVDALCWAVHYLYLDHGGFVMV